MHGMTAAAAAAAHYSVVRPGSCCSCMHACMCVQAAVAAKSARNLGATNSDDIIAFPYNTAIL